MLSTSALTWAAAQLNIPMWELIRSLNPTDETRIETAYAEWRRRAAAGERRHKVDWRTYPVADIISGKGEPEDVKLPATDVASVLDRPIPAEPVQIVETSEAEKSVPTVEENGAEESDAPWDEAEANNAEESDIPWDERDAAEDAAIEQVEEILSEESSDEEYISLADFNLEPSEAEMREMHALIRKDEPEDLAEPAPPAVAEVEKTEVDVAEPVHTDVAPPAAAKDKHSEAAVSTAAEVEAVAEEKAMAKVEAMTTDAVPIEQRISRLPKDATSTTFEGLLAALANDVEIAKAVTEAVIRDHTKRHRGTAAQRAFLAWLEKQ